MARLVRARGWGDGLAVTRAGVRFSDLSGMGPVSLLHVHQQLFDVAHQYHLVYFEDLPLYRTSIPDLSFQLNEVVNSV